MERHYGAFVVLELGHGGKGGFIQVRYLDGENSGIERWVASHVISASVATLQQQSIRGSATTRRPDSPIRVLPRPTDENRARGVRQEADRIAQATESYDELIRLAKVAKEKKEPEAAEVYLLRADQVSNGQTGWRVSLTAIYRSQNRHADVDGLRDPILSTVQNSAALNVKAGSLGDRGRYRDGYVVAHESLRVAGEHQRNRSFALNTLGRAAFNVGELEEAEWCFEQAGDTSSDWYGLLHELILAYRNRGDEAGASRISLVIARYWPQSAVIG